MTITHTSEREKGQIYVPEVNRVLMVACIWAGIPAFAPPPISPRPTGSRWTGTMAITTVLFGVVARENWGWSRLRAWGLCGLFLTVDLAFFSANIIKFKQGGWVPHRGRGADLHPDEHLEAGAARGCPG